MDNDGRKYYNLIWCNLYLRSYIVKHLNLINLYHHKRTCEIVDLKNNKESVYYKSLILNFEYDVYNEHLIEMMKYISSNVTSIEFGSDFGSPFNISTYVPPSVTSVSFNSSGRPIAGTIPSTLKSLKFGTLNDQLFIELLPLQGSLTNLDIGSYNGGAFKSNSFPVTLKSFKCNLSPQTTQFNLNSLPISNITNLDFSGSNLLKFTFDNGSGGGSDTNNLSSLINLKTLKFGQSFQDKIPIGYLPNGLQVLQLPQLFNIEENIKQGSIPSSVTKLCFPINTYSMSKHDFNKPLGKIYKLSSNKLPISLIKLEMGSNHFLEMLKSDQLNSFSKITFSSNTIKKSTIPRSVTKLRLCNGKYTTGSLVIPTHIQSISINGSFKIKNSSDLKELENIKITGCIFSQCFNVNNTTSKLKSLYSYDIEPMYNGSTTLRSLICSGSSNSSNAFNSLTSLSIYDNRIGVSLPFPSSLKILELNTQNHIDTSLLPHSIHTLIIRNSTCIKLPISPNIISIYINSSNNELLKSLNLLNNPKLLNIFKVIDDNNSRSTIKRLSKYIV